LLPYVEPPDTDSGATGPTAGDADAGRANPAETPDARGDAEKPDNVVMGIADFAGPRLAQMPDEPEPGEEPVPPPLPEAIEPALRPGQEPPGDVELPDDAEPADDEPSLSDESSLLEDDAGQCSRFDRMKGWLSCLPERRFEIGGWLEQGFTTNRGNPTNPVAGAGNLPAAFNYRNDEYMLNQFYLYAGRETADYLCGWDFGWRVDLLYGEDYIFAQSIGLETDDAGYNRWNAGAGGGGIAGTARLGLAMPQAYVDLAYNDLTLRIGHFYTIIGFETVAAPDNFFYSHAYTMLYGEPFTHTGALLSWQCGDRLKLLAGVHNGWNVVDASPDRATL